MNNLATLKKRILELGEEGDYAAIANLLKPLPVEDIGELINALPDDLQEPVFREVQMAVKPDVLAELSDAVGQTVAEALATEKLAELVKEMSPDDAADFLAELPAQRASGVLDLMDREDAAEVRSLLKYDPETAGGIMTTEVIALPADLTVAETIRKIAFLEEDEPYYNAYVVDEGDRLLGSITLWELIRTRDTSKKLGEVCHREVISVPVDADQEDAAHLISKYDLTALPVLDASGKLLGRVTIDDAIDVMEEEANEDIFRLAGSDEIELHESSPLLACRVRLPWLLITLATGFVTSFILKKYILDFNHVLALTFFVPVVMAMGGNAGIQSSTLVIRRIALDELSSHGFFKMLGREILAGAIMGLCCALIVGIWAAFLLHNPSEPPGHGASLLDLPLTIGLAMVCAMTFAVCFGATVPVLLNQLKIDPAVASGPFVTSSNDVFALLIYYGVSIAMIARQTALPPA